MAASEAMAWGLPGVSFDLEALKTYYPKGMLKTSCFDTDEFAENILNLLSNPYQYKEMSLEALQLVHEEWEWNNRAKDIFAHLTA
jgi:glycosyltransferase involved in cell wall biosynthesis